MFMKIDEMGEQVRNRVTLDCSNDDLKTEQAHKAEVDINNIVRRHGVDMIQKTAMLQTPEYQMDDISGNDFQEAMLKVTKAQQTFDQLPSKIRKEFDNNPAVFMDFVHNPDNQDAMIDLGLAQRVPVDAPVEVIVTNPEPAPEPVP
ncbi:internal scaffolding protein [Microviridae sp.]|nr:internal scaffolding protein [Microviridae sp.]